MEKKCPKHNFLFESLSKWQSDGFSSVSTLQRNSYTCSQALDSNKHNDSLLIGAPKESFRERINGISIFAGMHSGRRSYKTHALLSHARGNADLCARADAHPHAGTGTVTRTGIQVCAHVSASMRVCVCAHRNVQIKGHLFAILFCFFFFF